MNKQFEFNFHIDKPSENKCSLWLKETLTFSIHSKERFVERTSEEDIEQVLVNDGQSYHSSSKSKPEYEDQNVLGI